MCTRVRRRGAAAVGCLVCVPFATDVVAIENGKDWGRVISAMTLRCLAFGTVLHPATYFVTESLGAKRGAESVGTIGNFSNFTPFI
jgi:hypothetical protein